MLLLNHFQNIYTKLNSPFELDKIAKETFQNYFFPGNVRELRNIVIRLGAKYPGKTVTADELEAELETTVVRQFTDTADDLEESIQQELLSKAFSLDEAINESERHYINVALKLSGNNLSKAARLLGINRTTLYSRIQKLSDKYQEAD